MSKKPLLILNRKSGARPDIRPVIRSLQHEYKFDVVIPWTGKQLRKSVAKFAAKGGRRVIAGGGDGTLNSVANAVLRLSDAQGVSMGLVPLGTANDFARGFGDDASDIERSIRTALTDTPSPIDVGSVNGRYFVNVASGGFGAMITATTPQETKKRLGGLAYTLSGLARLSELTPNAATFTLDGAQTIETPVLALAIGNSRFAGGGFDVTPEARIDDGVLDLAVLAADMKLPAASEIGSILGTGTAEGGPLQRARFRSAIVETEQPFHLNLDGEPMVDCRFEVSVKPAALNFVLPSGNETG